MMVVGAFNQVQGAMRWFVDSFAAIANWRAALMRVAMLRDALQRADRPDPERERLVLEDGPDGILSLDGVRIGIPGDGVAICVPAAEIRLGERVVLTVPSGSGKSSLLKATAGLFPSGLGRDRPCTRLQSSHL